MCFAEHGRVAQLNPIVFCMMFGVLGPAQQYQTKNQRGTTFFKPDIQAKLKKAFAGTAYEQSAPQCIVVTTFAVAQVGSLASYQYEPSG